MDRIKIERAIAGLMEWRKHVQTNSDIDRDISTAIEALKAQLFREGTTKGTTSDTISRQAVIDALHTWFRDGFDEDKWWNSTHVLAAIEGLHPVQQEHKWETCFECPLSHGCPKIKGCTNEQAIEYASQIPNDCPLSAQPEPQEGHWIEGKIYRDVIECNCSECGQLMTTAASVRMNYCPNCGAKMKGEANER